MFAGVLYIFFYCLSILHRSVRDAIGNSFWIVYGLLFSRVWWHCMMFFVFHYVSAPSRGVGAMGPMFVAVVGSYVLCGCFHVRGEGSVLHRGLPLFCSIGSKDLHPPPCARFLCDIRVMCLGLGLFVPQSRRWSRAGFSSPPPLWLSGGL